MIEAVLADIPRAETMALILADAVPAKPMGLEHILPLTSLGLKPRDLRLRGMRCGRLVTGLSRAAARLKAVVPKLRARVAARAVDLFLSRDAMAPAALAAFMSDRAARRLCDRLVNLSAVRELTGRDSFGLYGV